MVREKVSCVFISCKFILGTATLKTVPVVSSTEIRGDQVDHNLSK